MALPTQDQITEQLRAVIDPELRKNIVELDMVRRVAIHETGVVDVTVSLTTPGCPIRNHFQVAVHDAVLHHERERVRDLLEVRRQELGRGPGLGEPGRGLRPRTAPA